MNSKFQLNLAVEPLHGKNPPALHVAKVGVVPFIPAPKPQDWRVLLMRPVAEAKHLGEPPFQLAKGTRRIRDGGVWRDMKDADAGTDSALHETLLETALREGREEVGLKPSNIVRLFDVGGFSFTSVSKAIRRPLHMFAAEIRDPEDFARFEASTERTRWMTLAECEKTGRPDHVLILSEIIGRLCRVYAER